MGRLKNIVNINKKQTVLPSKLRYKNFNFELGQDIAHNFNDFCVNIGNSVENKIPTAKKNFLAYMKKEMLTLFLQTQLMRMS